jgi:hypothetical protein
MYDSDIIGVTYQLRREAGFCMASPRMLLTSRQCSSVQLSIAEIGMTMPQISGLSIVLLVLAKVISLCDFYA